MQTLSEGSNRIMFNAYNNDNTSIFTSDSNKHSWIIDNNDTVFRI